MCCAPAPAMRSMNRPAAEACACEALSGRRRRVVVVGQRAADDQAARVVEVGARLGLQAEDGAVEQDPAQELGLRHDLGDVVDREQAEIGVVPSAGSGTKSTSCERRVLGRPPTK